MALKSQELQMSVENAVKNWNQSFPEHRLKSEDLSNPPCLMGAIFFIFTKLGISTDFVCAIPEDSNNESLPYYRDLVPVINTVRVINDFLAKAMQGEHRIMIKQILQPTAMDSRNIILILFNLYLFMETRWADIAEIENEIYGKAHEFEALQKRSFELLAQLNKQAEEKGLQAQRLEELRPEIKLLEDQLKQEKEAHNKEKQQLESSLKEYQQKDQLLEQKKAKRDALLAKLERKKALRVYNAEEIKANHEKVTKNVQEEEEKLNNLRAELIHKETSLKNLQTIKPSLDASKAQLYEIMKLTDSLKEYETDDLKDDGKESEQDLLDAEVKSLQATLSELKVVQAEDLSRRQESQAKRESEIAQVQSALREAEEKAKKHRTCSKKTASLIEELKQSIVDSERKVEAGLEELAQIKKDYVQDLKNAEEMLTKKMAEVEKSVDEKFKNNNLSD